MPRPPLRIYKTHQVKCANPECGRRQPKHDRMELCDAHAIAQCTCGQEYLLWIRGPFAIVIGLDPHAAARYRAMRPPLDSILREQHWIEEAA